MLGKTDVLRPFRVATGEYLSTRLRTNATGAYKAEVPRTVGARDTALVVDGSVGRDMGMEGAGGSGRGASGEGNCSSMHIEIYLWI